MSTLLLSLTRILPIEIDMLRIDNIFHTSAWLVSFGRTYYNVNSLAQVLLNPITVIALNVVSLIITKAIYYYLMSLSISIRLLKKLKTTKAILVISDELSVALIR